MRLRLSLVVVAALSLGAALPAWAWEDYEQGADVPTITVPAAPPSRERLPIFGVMADVGLPDGLIGSLTIRPWSWVRLSAGGGTNFISGGWRAGITLCPLPQVLRPASNTAAIRTATPTLWPGRSSAAGLTAARCWNGSATSI